MPPKRRFKKMNADWLDSVPSTSALDGDSSTGGTLQMVENCSKLSLADSRFTALVAPNPHGYSPLAPMYDHIKLMKGFYLSGALNKTVDDQTFHDTFVALFPGQEVFLPKYDTAFIRKKELTMQQCKMKVISFVEFMGKGDTPQDAFLEAIHAFRDQMDSYSHLFETYVKECVSKENNDSDKEKALHISRIAHQVVKINQKGDFCLPGFSSFDGPDRYSDFLEYCHYFSYQILSLFE